MITDSSDFQWYDAWILAALICATESAFVPLWQLVGVADALNKAIVSRDELETALARLDGAGYVRVVPGGFAATPKALSLRSPGPPVESVARAIAATPWSPETKMPRTDGEIYVSKSDYVKAVQKYRKEFWKAHRSNKEHDA